MHAPSAADSLSVVRRAAPADTRVRCSRRCPSLAASAAARLCHHATCSQLPGPKWVPAPAASSPNSTRLASSGWTAASSLSNKGESSTAASKLRGCAVSSITSQSASMPQCSKVHDGIGQADRGGAPCPCSSASLPGKLASVRVLSSAAPAPLDAFCPRARHADDTSSQLQPDPAEAGLTSGLGGGGSRSCQPVMGPGRAQSRDATVDPLGSGPGPGWACELAAARVASDSARATAAAQGSSSASAGAERHSDVTRWAWAATRRCSTSKRVSAAEPARKASRPPSTAGNCLATTMPDGAGSAAAAAVVATAAIAAGAVLVPAASPGAATSAPRTEPRRKGTARSVVAHGTAPAMCSHPSQRRTRLCSSRTRKRRETLIRTAVPAWCLPPAPQAMAVTRSG